MLCYSNLKIVNALLDSYPDEDTLTIYSAMIMLNLKSEREEEALDLIESTIALTQKFDGKHDQLAENLRDLQKNITQQNSEAQ